jgi:hypothetical protein
VRRIFAQVLDALGSATGMNASVNELLRQAALFVEIEGWASPGLLERRLRVNSHIAQALVETLRDQGMSREEAPHWLPVEQPLARARQRRLRKTKWKDHRKDSRPFVCIDCGREYEPTGANQKRCPDCRPTVKVALAEIPFDLKIAEPLRIARRRTSDPTIAQLAQGGERLDGL